MAVEQLDYSPAPPVLRRRPWVRRVTLGVILLVATVAGARWGPRVWRRATLLYWQRQCLHYTAPADRVVYETEPAAGAALRSADPHYQVASDRWARGRPQPPTGYVPECWSGFCRAGPGFRTATGPILFLHERTTASGRRRLVAIAEAFNPDDVARFVSGYDVGPQLIEPGTWKSPPENRTGGFFFIISGNSAQPRPLNLRVFAGQPDPVDASHFTIRYQVNGVNGVQHIADGWLRDDPRGGPEVVQFKVRQ